MALARRAVADDALLQLGHYWKSEGCGLHTTLDISPHDLRACQLPDPPDGQRDASSAHVPRRCLGLSVPGCDQRGQAHLSGSGSLATRTVGSGGEGAGHLQCRRTHGMAGHKAASRSQPRHRYLFDTGIPLRRVGRSPCPHRVVSDRARSPGGPGLGYDRNQSDRLGSPTQAEDGGLGSR